MHVVNDRHARSDKMAGVPRRRPRPRNGPRPRQVPTGLGRRMQTLRVQRGLTQVQLAQRASVSQAIVGRLEAGMRTGRLETWLWLAAALGVTLDELVGGGETSSPQ